MIENKEFKIQLNWEKQGEFSHVQYNRNHTVKLESGVEFPMSGAHTDGFADPELLVAASVSSCHMQTFIAVASKKRLVVATYVDNASAYLAQMEDGRWWVEKIVLRPQVEFEGEKIPTADVIASMHDKAHHHCFVGNSLKSEIVVEIQE